MNIQQKNSAHHFRMQSEREQTLVRCLEDATRIVRPSKLNYQILIPARTNFDDLQNL